MSLMSFIFKIDARSLPKRVNKWLYFKYLLTRQQMIFHLFFALTVSDREFSFPRFVGLLILSLWCLPSRKSYRASVFPFFPSSADKAAVQLELVPETSSLQQSVAALMRHHVHLQLLQDDGISTLLACNDQNIQRVWYKPKPSHVKRCI
jgi:hypothetical protein